MTINELRGVLKGRVLLPGEDGFDQAATAWNLTVRQPVAAVAELRMPMTWRRSCVTRVTRGGQV